MHWRRRTEDNCRQKKSKIADDGDRRGWQSKGGIFKSWISIKFCRFQFSDLGLVGGFIKLTDLSIIDADMFQSANTICANNFRIKSHPRFGYFPTLTRFQKLKHSPFY